VTGVQTCALPILAARQLRRVSEIFHPPQNAVLLLRRLCGDQFFRPCPAHRSPAAHFHPPRAQPEGQQQRDNRSVHHRLAHVRFHQPVVVHHARRRGDINQPVQHLPALASQPPDPSPCGRNRQRKQQNKSRETGGNERPFL